MKKIIISLSLFIFSCSATEVKNSQNYETLILQKNDKGQIWLSTLNSSQQVNITTLENHGDTIFVNYERGIFSKSNNIILFNQNIKFIKCANKKFDIEAIGN